jgi:hypothetical protein
MSEAVKPKDQPAHKADPIAAKEAHPAKRERLVDKAVEATFPASDPPSYMGGAATGGPRKGAVKPGEVDKTRP